jgi:psp operon transcriptional activator
MRTTSPTIIGHSSSLSAALKHVSQLASIDRPALIIGERGTGKELIAERLHYLSPRWDQTFTKINCSAIAETLLESELFGHEPGAFTGATKKHIGRFERTDGGTLFLDELATMSLRLQEKLLRVIEYGEFERVGGQKTLQVDVRLVGATNADLPALADRGQFRWDLLDRLSFDVVHLPPLRDRDDDVFELAEHFALRMCRELGWEYFPGFSDAALAQLGSHHWPGNIRELKNAVERSLFRASENAVPIEQIVINPFAPGNGTPITASKHSDVHGAPPTHLIEWPIDLKAAIKDAERDWLIRALAAAGQRQNEAATLLGLNYNQMRSLVRKHGLMTRPSRTTAETAKSISAPPHRKGSAT